MRRWKEGKKEEITRKRKQKKKIENKMKKWKKSNIEQT